MSFRENQRTYLKQTTEKRKITKFTNKTTKTMGCDIHIIAEVKDDQGKWQVNQEKIFPNPWYEPEAERDEKMANWSWIKEEFSTTPENQRSYDWFAILADVRNGRGFAGVLTGEGFRVIAEPRGIPSDASEHWNATCEEWDSDMHSHSYLYLSDFDNFDWNQVTMKTGVIELERYKELRGTNESPDSWSGAISGGNIMTVSQDIADKLLDVENLLETKLYSDKEIYVQYYWSVLYSEWFADHLKMIVEPLRELSKRYTDVRLVFGFDN